MRLIDVSNYQGHPVWPVVAKMGHVSGAFLKATEGTSFVDPTFARNRVEATKAGVHVGPYHFAHPEKNDPVQEAVHFANVVGRLKVGELRPVLDYEPPTSMTESHALRWIQFFNHEIKQRLGVWPIFYSYPALIAHLGLKAPVGAGLWLASYGVNDGKPHPTMVPTPWKKIVAHQFTSVGSVPGIAGHVDVDEAASLNALLAHPVRGQTRRPMAFVRRYFL